MKKKPVQRFDSVKIKATTDENGFLYDVPVVARIGLQTYILPDGTERREFRPASEVFSWGSLDSYRGKPITLGHVEVNSENAKEVMVGACTGNAYRQFDDDDYSEGVGVLCPITIHDAGAIAEAKDKNAAEISVGYTTIDIDQPGWGNNKTGEFFFDTDRPNIKQDELPGESSDWVRFDAVQTNIRVNHVALVFRGRAGIAKLNLDAEQEFPYHVPVTIDITKEDSVMTVKIKLDGEVVHEVAEAVADHINGLNGQVSTMKGKCDTLEAERDALKVKVDGIDKLISDAVAKAKADAESMASLVSIASEVGVKCDGLDAKGIKIAFVKTVSGIDVSEKDDGYINAAFDIHQKADKMAIQRKATTEGDAKNDAAESDIPDPQKRFRK